LPLHIFLVRLTITDTYVQGRTRIDIRSRQSFFGVISFIVTALFILFCTPLFSMSEDMEITGGDGVYTLSAKYSLDPEAAHYMLITVKAENTTGGNFPVGTCAVRWYAGPHEEGAAFQELFRFYIDGSSHRYHVPLGLDQGWSGSATLDRIILEFPRFENVEIEAEDAALKRRLFFPLDIYIARLISNLSPGTGTAFNRFMIPSYLLLLACLILAGIYYLLFRAYPGRKADRKRIARTAVFVCMLAIMLFFSATYIYREILAVKSHWASYGDDIISGDLEETYLGIYDLERFISWTAGIVPDDQGIILIVKGEPVYIMSEMAFNLYPRDIRFVDISGRTYDEINGHIQDISGDPAMGQDHDHLIILSEDDTWLASAYTLMARYRTTGGYIYKLR